MYRKDLLELLLQRPYTVAELAQLLDSDPRTVEEDLGHLFKSLRHAPYRAVTEPGRCRRCGFVFKADKRRKPGKCPQCRGTWIQPPTVRVERETGGA